MNTYFRIIDKNDYSGTIRYASLGSLYEKVESIVGDKLCENGIPVAIEAEGWGELACIGEVFETQDIVIIAED